MKNFFILFCILGIWKISSAQTNTFPSSGNVGIGNSSPSYNLDVSGTIRATNKFLIPSAMYGLEIDNPSGLYMYTNEINSKSGDVYLAYRGSKTVRVGSSIYFNGSENQDSYFNTGGNVAIGTTDPMGYKLAVNGSFIAESVKVKLQGSWPDYVFHRNYSLKPLVEIEKYIRTNHHLPEIPPAKEVEKDGIDLGEMNSRLLQKIEELTLYLIQQNKDIEVVKKQNEDQQKEIDQLKARRES